MRSPIIETLEYVLVSAMGPSSISSLMTELVGLITLITAYVMFPCLRRVGASSKINHSMQVMKMSESPPMKVQTDSTKLVTAELPRPLVAGTLKYKIETAV